MMEFFYWLMPELTTMEWSSHISIFIINITLLIFAEPLVNLSNRGVETKARVRIFKALNILVLILHVMDLALLRLTGDLYEGFLIRIGLSLMAIYAGLFIYGLASFFSHKRFGKEKQLDNKTVYTETYSTRIIDLIAFIIVSFTVVYTLIKIWGADSMLETTGIIGILAAFLAFTSNIWAPDIISGLIILNSQMLDDGDVVVIDGYPDEYIINKVTFIYIILYDIQNNHRTLIRNSRFIQSKIDNLSRVASTDGIRKHITYKIGYASTPEEISDQRLETLTEFHNRVNRMFEKANNACIENSDIKINEHKPFEWALTNTGDYALEYTMWFYLDRLPNTKVTATIRKHLMGTIYKVNQAVYVASVTENIQLATPNLNTITLNNNNANEIPNQVGDDRKS